jgi:hypothetical protein
MSERLTSVAAPGVWGSGYAEHGRKTRAEMIAAYRQLHTQKMQEAQAALAVPDEDLKVTTYLGAWARKNVREVTE